MIDIFVVFFLFCRKNYIFWMDVTSDRLYRSRLNGSDTTLLVSTNIGCSGNWKLEYG